MRGSAMLNAPISMKSYNCGAIRFAIAPYGIKYHHRRSLNVGGIMRGSAMLNAPIV